MFLSFIVKQPKEGKELHEIPIVWEFLDVFPNEFSILPPKQKIKFGIDYIPGTTPVSKALYMMDVIP